MKRDAKSAGKNFCWPKITKWQKAMGGRSEEIEMGGHMENKNKIKRDILSAWETERLSGRVGEGEGQVLAALAAVAIETCTIFANFRATPRWAWPATMTTTTKTEAATGKWVTRVTSGSQLYSQWSEISRLPSPSPLPCIPSKSRHA